jgi:hypothetical protein
MKNFIKYTIIWISQNLAIPFWAVGHVHLSMQLLDENAYLKDLAVGTLETIKHMPDYEEAIDKLKAQVTEKASARAETES